MLPDQQTFQVEPVDPFFLPVHHPKPHVWMNAKLTIAFLGVIHTFILLMVEIERISILLGSIFTVRGSQRFRDEMSEDV